MFASDTLGGDKSRIGDPFGRSGVPLKMSGQVTIAPVRGSALRITDLWQNDEPGEILIDRTEAIGLPKHPLQDHRQSGCRNSFETSRSDD